MTDRTATEYRCGWCSTGHHERCPGTTTTMGGRKQITCSCSLTWRHADLPAAKEVTA